MRLALVVLGASASLREMILVAAEGRAVSSVASSQDSCEEAQIRHRMPATRVCEDNPRSGGSGKRREAELADGATHLRNHRQAGACRCHQDSAPKPAQTRLHLSAAILPRFC